MRRNGRDAPEAIVSVVAIVGGECDRGCGKTRSQRRRVGSNIQRNGLPAHPGTQARTACSNGATPKIAIARFTL
jgi:hypothetical protein